eukprot:gnl/Dysnectes_brevis/2224_a2597_2558.p1 GENE.gnl/Dysnectes_brevis/2224_a2597_2558~~gnl/Dysnectes_brevis/2224_a2597_2558.p1  ORF type:complete len:233 (-),score=3.39 gnl/Dysnectes_brevis/2224_a2597_2558:66-764(-)
MYSLSAGEICFVEESAKHKIRLDGRKSLLEHREVNILTGTLSRVDSSSEVKIGGTHIVCAIRERVIGDDEESEDDEPQESMQISLHSAGLQRIVLSEEELNQSDIVIKQCIAGMSFPSAYTCDITVISGHANIPTAATLALLEALRNIHSCITVVERIAIPVVLALVADMWLLDPTPREYAASSKVMVVWGRDSQVMGVDIRGTGTLSPKQLASGIEIGANSAALLAKSLGL